MKVGDLVNVKRCLRNGPKCDCFFCKGKSNYVGLVTGYGSENGWNIMFDCGERNFTNKDYKHGKISVITRIS